MAPLSDRVRVVTALGDADVARLRDLVSEWRLLADLSFSDLRLCIPTRDGSGFLVAAQERPTTGPTALAEDEVGRQIPLGRYPLVDAACDDGRVHREGDPEWSDIVPVRAEAVPVSLGGRVIAVVLRTGSLVSVRMPSRLELAYQDSAAVLTRMIAEGRFPSEAQADLTDSPRVGDGFIRLQSSGVVDYASPNAMSAFRRMGLAGDLVHAHLGEITTGLVGDRRPAEESLSTTLSGRGFRRIEVETSEAVLTMRVIPLQPGGQHQGAVVLVRDVTDVRERERELVTKEATIREIHHRVKNNLQTVAALLRLQARRIAQPEARAALQEAERRIGSIAVVHDVLAGTPEEWVDFDEVVDRLILLVPDMAGGRHVTTSRHGRFGVVAGSEATPLAMVLTELVQNAVRHGFAEDVTALRTAPRGEGEERIEVHAQRSGSDLRMVVRDNGRGLPPDVDLTASLGLHIARTLLADLSGSLELCNAPPAGVDAVVRAAVTDPGSAPASPPDGGARGGRASD